MSTGERERTDVAAGVELAGMPLSRRAMLGAAMGASAAVLAAGSARSSAESTPAQPDAARSPRPSLKAAREAVEAIGGTIVQISRDVWALPAVGLHEHEAMEVHIKALEADGFTITSRQSAGHPTAFIAEWSLGSGGPRLGFLPEYDALPGLSNTAEPMRKPTPDGDTDGHGCGHNILGAGCTGAAMALKRMMEARGIAGTLRVYGCGAEENEGAKVYMAAKGMYNDLDAAIAWHPAPAAVTGTITTNAMRKIFVTFRGKTAHAGMDPWEGRSALDAAELFTHAVNLMREHVRPTARNHYIYQIAGVAPNVVPDEARIWMMTRDITSEYADATVEWLRQMAEGAALATQTRAEFRVPHGMKELISNQTLAARVDEHMRNLPIEWTTDEQAFAKACQKAMGVPEAGMATGVVPMLRDATSGGSTDVADVAWNCPTAFFGWPTHPLGVSAHTWVVTACGGMSIGDKGALNSAVIMAALGMDLLTEPELRSEAKAELARRLNGRTYAATLELDASIAEQAAKRFGKGPGDEALSNVGG